jgi:ABC-type dipeptide/oligopeptide/nickel transport system permease component
VTEFAERALRHVATLLAIIVASFFLFHVVPVDPARASLGAQATQEQAQRLRTEFGLDRPLPEQLFRFTSSTLRLDFGRSYVDQRPVGAEVRKRLPTTLALTGLALTLAMGYAALVLWLLSAKAHSVVHWSNRVLALLPTLFVTVVAAIAAQHFYPFSAYSADLSRPKDWMALLPPAMALGLFGMLSLGRVVDGKVRELEGTRFVSGARARGLSVRSIYFGHLLRHVMGPLLASMSTLIPYLLSAAFLVETVFSLPGLGTMLVNAILRRDLPTIEAVVMVNALLIIGVFVLCDLLTVAADPRLRGTSRAA